MKISRIYIFVSLFVILIIIGIIGWAIFIGRQQQALQEGTTNLGSFSSGSSGDNSSSGGFLNNLFDTDEAIDNADTEAQLRPTLRQIYTLPIAGYAKRRADQLRLVDRATGHIFEITLPDGSAKRINQSTVPQVYESVFLNDATRVIRRYIDTNESLVSVSSLLTSTTQGEELTGAITAIQAHRDTNAFAFVRRTSTGSETGIADGDGLNEEILFTSGIRGWQIAWENNTIILTQNAASSLPGSAYAINTETKEVSLALQQQKGLLTLISPNGNQVLYSTTETNGKPSLAVKNLTTGITRKLNVIGLAEKCAWLDNDIVYCGIPEELPDGTYPDEWYMSAVQFSDSFWRIQTSTGSTQKVYSPYGENAVSLDAVSLSVYDGTKSTVLFFKNKSDQSLWSLSFPKPQEEESEDAILTE